MEAPSGEHEESGEIISILINFKESSASVFLIGENPWFREIEKPACLLGQSGP